MMVDFEKVLDNFRILVKNSYTYKQVFILIFQTNFNNFQLLNSSETQPHAHLCII